MVLFADLFPLKSFSPGNTRLTDIHSFSKYSLCTYYVPASPSAFEELTGTAGETASKLAIATLVTAREVS